MTIKEEYKRKIDEVSSTNFNADQKELAKQMIDASPEGQEHQWFSFIVQRVKLGFRFDASPDVLKDTISIIEEDKKLRINVTDEVTEDENKLIIGDNYDALKNLLITHRNMIDVIYIDPPYNTESSKTDGNELSEKDDVAASKFVYRDKFSRPGWLNMIRERLLMAKDLLSNDGVIFVSIDDTEQAYLKVLMDEIFGLSGFIGTFIRDLGKDGQKTVRTVNVKHEYIICFTKNINIEFLGTMINSTDYSLSDEYENTRGKYHDKLTLDASGLSYSKNLDYIISAPDGTKIAAGSSKKTNEERMLLRDKRINEGARKADWQWRWNKIAFEKALKLGYFYFKKTTNGWQVKQKHYLKSAFDTKTHTEYNVERKQFLRSIIETGTKEGSNMIKEQGLSFPNPKPVSLIKKILSQFHNNIFVLDFFAGSGTTGQAVMELNNEDKGNRKYILCTNNENNIAIDITYERMRRVITGVGTRGEKDFNWIKKNEPYKNAKLRVFNLKQHSVRLSDDPRELKEFAKKEFKKLSPTYDKNDNLDLYRDLNSLHPLKKDK